ncbi:hypothetical protein EMIHUDRAFT_208872 [Emiliania huxleyi CCMP1516]|uniref:Thioredoxin domain-containing protein n=2 Tax=Emiliania huxleyi TaxID=2903 RepID=A0A0D3J980_EMIH1|nr:hypothetical protein EMIHUDRAFT_208872 [Emiliania huxleyi CCMP1516]EOD20065.1 hypothetical protein EMIHUDRAFT_208872 [Emiliania huxleyi CCMP1516]|eukprot:XP_005772494.1 hypothetical protein EMIHUDRAFT_208872 [Emiliania huxleyi CCMP1516]
MGRKSYGPVLNYFKHVPDDLVVTSTPGLIISALGTVVLITLFLFELSAYLTVTSTTDLVVDELVDETLRVNFNVTLHQVPCEFLSDILKWRLDSNQRVVRDAAAVSAVETRDAKRAADAAMSKEPVSPSYGDEDEEEPPDTDLSQPLSPDTFVPFLQQHELSLVNFYAPWCIWCQRLEPVYLEAAAKEFELFTDERSVGAILGFVRKQMAFSCRSSHAMPIVAANTFCGNNEECIGFTYAAEEMPAKDAKPDPAAGRARRRSTQNKQRTSYPRLKSHHTSRCMVAGHLRVRKVPGVLKLVLHSPEHDHEHALINSSHAVNEFWACADGSLCCEQVIGIIEAVLHTATESFLKKQM